MKLRMSFGGAFAALLLVGVSASQAHHAVQASVDIDKTVKMKATLTRIAWVNPHTWMYFDYTDPATGKVGKVAVESLGIAALRQQGIDSRSAFHVGEAYDISFYPNRDGTLGGFMFRMILPDGRSLDVGNTDPSAGIPKPTN